MDAIEASLVTAFESCERDLSILDRDVLPQQHELCPCRPPEDSTQVLLQRRGPKRKREAARRSSGGAGSSTDQLPPSLGAEFTGFVMHELPADMIDRIFCMVSLADLGRVVATCRQNHDRLAHVIRTASARLGLAGVTASFRLESINSVLRLLDNALPRLPRAIVVTWLADVDWRVRLAALRALSLKAGDNSSGNSAQISVEHRAAITDLQNDPSPPVREAAQSLVARIAGGWTRDPASSSSDGE